MKKIDRILRIVAGTFFLLVPVSSAAGTSGEQVRSTVDKVVAIVQDPRSGNERRDQLRRVIAGRFDFTEMAKRSLGSHWQGRTPMEQAEFVKLFADLLGGLYVEMIESYAGDAGDRFVYLREEKDGDFSQVDSKIVTAKGDELSIGYKLRSAKDGWKIYDVLIENVSLVNNYRSQFNRVLSGGSFDELLKRLRETRAKLQAKISRPETAIVSYWILAAASPNRPR